ncbi:hypothetical protein MVQ18_10180 [Fusobacterium necrophorum]|uniref:hypothetical protein n=1 Tax=Fusobacterium necrophorum TaxID=859 RepID=UPI00254BD0D2|nr:hypothetical protein [Fusobacterium necrophorum]MDK4473091.1 hypothetical protein [Fusobacterium necrophorum]MDK4478543.1 hypothetical protein [Fusobacterium necrophorum]MDK4517110.1 hypothetical protein [Fusobacterium necrophorum]MDK4519012.1 hypothetical protein [Fusobacterium necrophorum]
MVENTWGGKREGSGRKEKKNKKVTKSFVISPELLEKIEKKYPNQSFSKVIEEALMEFLKE